MPFHGPSCGVSASQRCMANDVSGLGVPLPVFERAVAGVSEVVREPSEPWVAVVDQARSVSRACSCWFAEFDMVFSFLGKKSCSEYQRRMQMTVIPGVHMVLKYTGTILQHDLTTSRPMYGSLWCAI